MLRQIVFLLFLAMFLSVVPAQAKTRPVNEQIMYGEVERTEALLEANKLFLEKVDAAGVSRQQASVQFARLGWQYLGKGDVPTASRRFNQAWLLDPDNYLAYWAFGILAFDRDNRIDFSTEMFEKALSLKRTSAILADYGRVCERAGQTDKAIRLFKEGLAVNPMEKRSYVGLMRAYDANKDWKMIRHWLQEGERAKVFSPEEVTRYRNWLAESERIASKQ